MPAARRGTQKARRRRAQSMARRVKIGTEKAYSSFPRTGRCEATRVVAVGLNMAGKFGYRQMWLARTNRSAWHVMRAMAEARVRCFRGRVEGEEVRHEVRRFSRASGRRCGFGRPGRTARGVELAPAQWSPRWSMHVDSAVDGRRSLRCLGARKREKLLHIDVKGSAHRSLRLLPLH